MGSCMQHRRSSFLVRVQVLARPSSNAHQPWTAPSLQCESSLAIPLPFAVQLCLPPSEASATSDQSPVENQQHSGGPMIMPMAAEEGAETGEHRGVCFFLVDRLASLTNTPVADHSNDQSSEGSQLAGDQTDVCVTSANDGRSCASTTLLDPKSERDSDVSDSEDCPDNEVPPSCLANGWQMVAWQARTKQTGRWGQP